MAVLDLNHNTSRPHGAGAGRFTKVVADIREYFARRELYRQTVRELSELSTRDLADLGISRAAIPSIAHDATWGRK